MTKRVLNKTRYIALLLFASALIAVSGCGGATATVSGKVTFQDRPVTYGSVIFLGSDKTARSGAIQADGSYTVEGIHPGEVRIAVISRDPAKVRTHQKGTAGGQPANKNWFPLPAKFEDPEKSGLGCTLDSGTVSYNIELK